MKLPDELVGKWIVDSSGRVVGDEAEKRIWEAVRNHLIRVGERDGGWTTLYRDPSDNLHWELTFPQGEMHGGGPAKLTRIEAEEIPRLYSALKTP